MAYSGTPEPTRFGEPDSGNVLVVEIAQAGAPPDIRTVKTAQLRWLQIGVGETITASGTLADIARSLTQIPQQDQTLVEIVLTGLLFECDQDEIARIERACSHFLHARIDRTRLRPTPEDHDWVEHLPAGAARIAATRLRQMASGNGADAETATQALLELYAFAQEIRS
jgi:hypothetical protein